MQCCHSGHPVDMDAVIVGGPVKKSEPACERIKFWLEIVVFVQCGTTCACLRSTQQLPEDI